MNKKWTDTNILSLDIWDTKDRIILIRLNKYLEDKDLREYLEHRYSYWNNSYKDVVNLIKKNYKEWPKCPTCHNYIDNLKHIHCSTRCSTLDPTVKQKLESSMFKKYGVKNAFNKPEVKKKAQKAHKDSIIEKYGSLENWAKLIAEKSNKTRKIKQENDKNYWKDIRRKQYDTIKQLDIENPGYKLAIKQKEIVSKKKNGTLNTSKTEEFIKQELLKLFDKNDILCEYSQDKRYPFHCDFYIKSRDLFIECNFHWTHCEHWFNFNSKEDINSAQKLKNSNSQYCKNAYNTWTIRDVEKRNKAKLSRLNYVVFWSIEDFLLWNSINQPDGQDWNKEYSWIKYHKVTDLNNLLSWPNELDNNYQNHNKIVKKVNWKEFYKREIALWNENKNNFQVKLYKNRLKYINKGPLELNDLEILRGINISGYLRAYSTFDNSGLQKLLKKYKITSMYDFCAGWGERLTTCALLNVRYLGIDINLEVINGHKEIVRHYKLKNQQTLCKDSANYKPTENFDLVFTCPPYLDYEVYTTKGAENLKEKEYFEWWRQSILNSEKCNFKYFAYQINQKNKNKLNKVLIDLGYIKIDEIDLRQKRNHFNHKDKIDFESIEVFTKKLK